MHWESKVDTEEVVNELVFQGLYHDLVFITAVDIQWNDLEVDSFLM